MQRRQQTRTASHRRSGTRRDGRVDRAISAARTARSALERCAPGTDVEG